MKNAIRLVAASALLMSAGAVFSQQAAPVATVAAEPRNVVQLSAAGMVQVEQDMLTITLMANKEAPTLAAAQTQLKQALDEALAQAKAGAQPGQMDVSTGTFSLYPRYGKDQKVLGWQGRAELRLEGRDFGRITGMAGKIQSMAVSDVSFGLSREARAIEQFKTRAAELSKAFGFASYGLREVSVSGQGQGVTLMGAMVAREKMASFASDAPVPVQPGREQVSISVSGTVQMR